MEVGDAPLVDLVVVEVEVEKNEEGGKSRHSKLLTSNGFLPNALDTTNHIMLHLPHFLINYSPLTINCNIVQITLALLMLYLSISIF